MKYKWPTLTLVATPMLFACYLGIRIGERVQTADVHYDLNAYRHAYVNMLATQSKEKKLDWYEKHMLPILEKYPKLMGANDSKVLGKHFPLLVILPSPQHKYMGIVYGDYDKHKANNTVAVKLGSKRFFEWQDTLLTNPVIRASFTLMPKEHLKRSIMQMIKSSE